MSDDLDEGCAVLITIPVVMVGFPIIAMLFPAARSLPLFKEVLTLFAAFGVHFPSIGGGPSIVVAVYIGLVVLIFVVGGVLTAAALSRFLRFEVNLQAVGALASILGLIVSLISLLFR